MLSLRHSKSPQRSWKSSSCRLDVRDDLGPRHVERLAEHPVGMLAGDLRLAIDGVEERVDELAHAVLPEVAAGRAEVGAVPVAGAVPPAPVAMIDVAADVAHQVGDAEDLAEVAGDVGLPPVQLTPGWPQPVPLYQ